MTVSYTHLVVLLTLALSLLVFLIGASVNRLLRELQALLSRPVSYTHLEISKAPLWDFFTFLGEHFFQAN